MITATPTETLKEEDVSTEMRTPIHDEIERLLWELSAKWDEEDFMDLPPKGVPFSES